MDGIEAKIAAAFASLADGVEAKTVVICGKIVVAIAEMSEPDGRD